MIHGWSSLYPSPKTRGRESLWPAAYATEEFAKRGRRKWREAHTKDKVYDAKEAPGIFPRIFGHEAVGTVESVGEHVEGFKYGDLVIPVFLSNCQECIDCKSTKSNLCSNHPFTVMPGMRDGSSRFTDARGEVLHNFLRVSSFVEYTVVDVVNMVKIDSGIPPQKACLFSCGVSTGVGAAWKVAGVEEGSTVAVFGLGAIGLAASCDVAVVFSCGRLRREQDCGELQKSSVWI
ncbi:hypothetical protein ACLOJK_016356 [Asimina triloba]